MGDKVPHYAHHLITLLLGSQVKHEIIYTRSNRKRVDEWIQHTIQFYRHEFQRRKKRSRAAYQYDLTKTFTNER